jgi:hypothetical protein
MRSHISEGKRSALGFGTEGPGGTAGEGEVGRNGDAPSEGSTGSKKRSPRSRRGIILHSVRLGL